MNPLVPDSRIKAPGQIGLSLNIWPQDSFNKPYGCPRDCQTNTQKDAPSVPSANYRTHMSRASRWMNKLVLESAQIWVCDWVSVNIRSGDLVATVDTSAPSVLPIHPFISHILKTRWESEWRSRGSRAEWRKLQYVYPSWHFGRSIVEVSGCQTPTLHTGDTHEPSHAIRVLSANKSSCFWNERPNKYNYISVKIGTNLFWV